MELGMRWMLFGVLYTLTIHFVDTWLITCQKALSVRGRRVLMTGVGFCFIGIFMLASRLPVALTEAMLREVISALLVFMAVMSLVLFSLTRWHIKPEWRELLLVSCLVGLLSVSSVYGWLEPLDNVGLRPKQVYTLQAFEQTEGVYLNQDLTHYYVQIAEQEGYRVLKIPVEQVHVVTGSVPSIQKLPHCLSLVTENEACTPFPMAYRVVVPEGAIRGVN